MEQAYLNMKWPRGCRILAKFAPRTFRDYAVSQLGGGQSTNARRADGD